MADRRDGYRPARPDSRRCCSGCCASAPACRKLRKSAWLPGRRPRSRSEQLGADAICEMTRLLPPKRTLCAGLRAWMVNSGGAVRDQLEDHVAVEAHPLAALAHVGAVLLHDLRRAVMQHVDADLLAARAARRDGSIPARRRRSAWSASAGSCSCRNGGCSKAAEPPARFPARPPRRARSVAITGSAGCSAAVMEFLVEVACRAA